MTTQTPAVRIAAAAPRSEAEMARDPDALAGRVLVEARVARHSRAEQDAFWVAVHRCFGGGTPMPARG